MLYMSFSFVSRIKGTVYMVDLLHFYKKNNVSDFVCVPIP